MERIDVLRAAIEDIFRATTGDRLEIVLPDDGGPAAISITRRAHHSKAVSGYRSHEASEHQSHRR